MVLSYLQKILKIRENNYKINNYNKDSNKDNSTSHNKVATKRQ